MNVQPIHAASRSVPVVYENLLLDRAVVTMLALGANSKQGHPYRREDLEHIINLYRTILYERPGTSVFETRLRELRGISQKLVGIPEGVESERDISDAGLIQATMSHVCSYPSILLAHKYYQSQISGASYRSCQEDLGYIIRLLRLARRFKTDILIWSPRKHLFLSLFEAAAIRGTLSSFADGITRFISDPCQFPYLPPVTNQTVQEEQHRFAFLVYEPDSLETDSKTRLTSDHQSVPVDTTTLPVRNKVFISYSHQDKVWLERLKTIINPVVGGEKLAIWDDTRIKTGVKWKEEIENAIATAKVAVLLVSDNFLNSRFIADHELPRLLNAAKQDNLTIFWVPISHCLYQSTEIADYQAAHNPDEPLDSLNVSKRKKVLAEIGKNIMDIFQSNYNK